MILDGSRRLDRPTHQKEARRSSSLITGTPTRVPIVPYGKRVRELAGKLRELPGSCR
jgi:hypothetical protein